MWEGFRTEFLALWSAAVERGSGGALAHAALFGRDAPDGAEALHVSDACLKGRNLLLCMVHHVRPACELQCAVCLLHVCCMHDAGEA
jgi:hypothetical protein